MLFPIIISNVTAEKILPTIDQILLQFAYFRTLLGVSGLLSSHDHQKIQVFNFLIYLSSSISFNIRNCEDMLLTVLFSTSNCREVKLLRGLVLVLNCNEWGSNGHIWESRENCSSYRQIII